MVVEYGLVALIMALVYGLVKQFLPDFPLDNATFSVLFLYVLAKLGVEVIGAPVRAFLTRKFPKLFGVKPAKKAK
jgi:hypothetical protein